MNWRVENDHNNGSKIVTVYDLLEIYALVSQRNS